MSIKGSSYARFRRALQTENLPAIRMAALELPYVNLDDAMAICLVMSRQGDRRFERAGVRWLARLCLERPAISLADLRQATDAVTEMRHHPRTSRATLADICDRLDLRDTARLLRRDT